MDFEEDHRGKLWMVRVVKDAKKSIVSDTANIFVIQIYEHKKINSLDNVESKRRIKSYDVESSDDEKDVYIKEEGNIIKFIDEFLNDTSQNWKQRNIEGEVMYES